MRRALLVVGSWIACGAWLAASPAPRPAENRPGALGSLAVPGGVDALAAAAGLPVPAPRATVSLELIRRLHGASAGDPAVAARRQAVVAALAQPAAGAAAAAGETIPLPFDEDLWTRIIFRRTVTSADLAAAILTRPQGAWFYYGAMGLDDETRAWFRARPHRLLRIGAQVGAFAAFGPSLRVRGERVASPGGPAADPVWKALVGASPADADAFVDKLLGARAGRLAWLYDTVSRLDAGMQRHLLDGDGALDRHASPRRRLRPRQPGMADRGSAAVAAAGRSRDAAAGARGRAGRLADPSGAGGLGWHVRPPGAGRRRLAGRSRLFRRWVGAARSLRSGAVRDALDARRARAGVSRRARSLRGRAGAGVDAGADRRPRQRRGHATARGCCRVPPCARMRRRCACSRRRWR